MKIRLLSLAVVALCVACSAPKMAYKFDYHDYNAGRKAKEVKEEVANNPGPVPVNPETLIAMEPVKEAPVASIETPETPALVAPGKTYEEMSKQERRELRREFKKEVKSIVKKDGGNSVSASKAIDRDLKLAAIFGAVGIVGLIISGQVFYIIGGIALIIGIVFFVRWLIRQ
jgi:hypothetical protein